MRTDSGIRLLYKEKMGAVFYKTGNKNGLGCCTIGEMFLEKFSQDCFNKVLNSLKATGSFDVINISIIRANPLYHFFRRKGFLINPRKPF